ncbi:conserved hypothetical protein [Talaromyces stipitatus ATCC 10500]|uniref:Protein kinase domain-containing protein n=1 Tax=Talaromyces stipitatus (strain ATCC 10500 / CBS 375.48 / QM 6759 / NRRL 1006) TaxID=441959 RepID=B8LU50_TALSN|nr:uncharacterized protein TSTA_060190 [Talaromyces stipitatus ATCC 10500]EED22522.1 conserved hypothetical protein [Talaromyces stipitatus ATCC 10500]
MVETEPALKIMILPKTYEEERQSGQIQCSQKAIIQQVDRRWHIRVTCCELAGLEKRIERRDALRRIIKATNFVSLNLLKDTVTQIRITHCPSLRPLHSEQTLHYETSEDQRRIRYPFTSLYSIEHGLIEIRSPSLPTFRCRSLPAIAVEKVQELDDINGQVFRVRIEGKDGDYIHKTLDRPWYEPSDTIAFEHEMQNSLLLRGIPNIGQIIGVTVGKNIYQTTQDSETPEVIHGMLFKYYPGGTIKQLQQNNQKLESWRKWPLQISHALRELHKSGLAHMDIKPSNIVLDKENNAVIIDLGGQSITYEWLAPELREKENVLMSCFEDKVRGELWTLGKLFSELIIYNTGGLENDYLSYISNQLMHDDPTSRISLDLIHNSKSGFIPVDLVIIKVTIGNIPFTMLGY